MVRRSHKPRFLIISKASRSSIPTRSRSRGNGSR